MPWQGPKTPAFDTDLAQEARLIALNALQDRDADRNQMLMLGGTMYPHAWMMNGAIRGQHRPITARSGERLVLLFHNLSTMGRAMYLPGHVSRSSG